MVEERPAIEFRPALRELRRHRQRVGSGAVRNRLVGNAIGDLFTVSIESHHRRPVAGKPYGASNTCIGTDIGAALCVRRCKIIMVYAVL